MLALTCNKNERIIINVPGVGLIKITVARTQPSRARLLFEAPSREIQIDREAVYNSKQETLKTHFQGTQG